MRCIDGLEDDKLACAVVGGASTGPRRRRREERGPLMPILRELQEVFGHIDPRAVDVVAEALNLSKAEVYGVITFYKDFRSEPPGASLIAEVAMRKRASPWVPSGSPVTPVSTLASSSGARRRTVQSRSSRCSVSAIAPYSPAVMVDGRLKGRVDEARFDELVADARGQAT